MLLGENNDNISLDIQTKHLLGVHLHPKKIYLTPQEVFGCLRSRWCLNMLHPRKQTWLAWKSPLLIGNRYIDSFMVSIFQPVPIPSFFSVCVCNILRLFQYTFSKHPEQPLLTACQGNPFIVGVRGIFGVQECWTHEKVKGKSACCEKCESWSVTTLKWENFSATILLQSKFTNGPHPSWTGALETWSVWKNPAGWILHLSYGRFQCECDHSTFESARSLWNIELQEAWCQLAQWVGSNVISQTRWVCLRRVVKNWYIILANRRCF